MMNYVLEIVMWTLHSHLMFYMLTLYSHLVFKYVNHVNLANLASLAMH